ncbi:hypothetical protein ACLOJK_034327 [Asimina triloba]
MGLPVRIRSADPTRAKRHRRHARSRFVDVSRRQQPPCRLSSGSGVVPKSGENQKRKAPCGRSKSPNRLTSTAPSRICLGRNEVKLIAPVAASSSPFQTVRYGSHGDSSGQQNPT